MTTLEITANGTGLEVTTEVVTIEISQAIYTGVRQPLDASLLDEMVDGLVIRLVAAENLVFGDVVYLDGVGKAAKADATAVATSLAIAMATDTIVAESEGVFLLLGIARNDAWSWGVGQVFLSETPGQVTQTAPITTNSVTQVIGSATNTNHMYFNPSSDLLVHV